MKVKLFYSKIVDTDDILNAYAKNHPCVDFQPEPELTQEIEPDLLEIEPISLFEKVAGICKPK